MLVLDSSPFRSIPLSLLQSFHSYSLTSVLWQHNLQIDERQCATISNHIRFLAKTDIDHGHTYDFFNECVLESIFSKKDHRLFFHQPVDLIVELARIIMFHPLRLALCLLLSLLYRPVS